MTFALATLAFLTAAWLAIVALGVTLEDYGPRILAALSGRPPETAAIVSLRVRARYPARRTIRPRPRPAMRAAA